MLISVFLYCNSRIFMNHDMSMLLKGQEDPVEDSSTPKNFFKNPSRLLPKNKNMTSRSNRQTCLDSKLMCCSTTKTVADQPLLALTLHVFPTVLISSDTLNSSFQVSQSQHRLTELYLFMVSPMTCMEVGTCTISLSISETLDLWCCFMFPTKRGSHPWLLLLLVLLLAVTCYFSISLYLLF